MPCRKMQRAVFPVPRGVTRAFLLRVISLALVFFVCGCADKSQPSVLLALDGPPLAVVGALGDAPFDGVMDRGCLAGVGSLKLHVPDLGPCAGTMDHPGNEKGRRYVELACFDGSSIILALRNLGPDQGMGIGKQDTTGKRIALFYHPSQEEAQRRLAGIRADLARSEESLARKQAGDKEQTPPSAQ